MALAKRSSKGIDWDSVTKELNDYESHRFGSSTTTPVGTAETSKLLGRLRSRWE